MEVLHEQDQSHVFFGHLQQPLYPLGLDNSQIDGHEAVLDEWERNHAAEDDRWLAYMLATAQREAGAGFQPICENLNYSAEGLLATFPKYSSVADAQAHANQPERITNRAYASWIGYGNEKTGDGWHYRGRGLVQITGEANNTKFGCVQNRTWRWRQQSGSCSMA